MPSTRKVLSVGTDAELLWLRDAVLRSAGFDVLTTLDQKQGLATIERGYCHVLVLCHSLPLFARKRLAEKSRVRCPDGHIITIVHEKAEPEFADTVVYGPDGPETLIQAIRNA